MNWTQPHYFIETEDWDSLAAWQRRSLPWLSTPAQSYLLLAAHEIGESAWREMIEDVLAEEHRRLASVRLTLEMAAAAFFVVLAVVLLHLGT